MTSWIRRGKPLGATGGLTNRDELDVVFQAGKGGFCTQFNRYFYHVFYSRRIGKELYVKQEPNIMGDTYPLLQTVFADISGVRFVTDKPVASPRQEVKLFDLVSRTPRDTLREAAREVLRWRPDLEAQIRSMLGAMGIPDKFDIGVHMRTGTKSVDRYLRAVEAFVATAPPGRKVRVFVASDNGAMLKEFEARTRGATYEVFNIAGSQTETGFDAAVFAAKPFDDKFNDAMVFFTELYLLQKCPMLVCSLSSNVGKFLLLTAASARNFKSLDLPELVPL
jgi:hypothetical protein